VKFLLDQNLSPKLVAELSESFPDSIHVRDIGLEAADDIEVWNYARDHEFTIISKDADFHQRSFLYGAPPKVVWVSVGNCTTADIEELLKASHSRLIEFYQDEEATFLVLS
jgi:predicted nuclease of predicted toxin-antitoxin system